MVRLIPEPREDGCQDHTWLKWIMQLETIRLCLPPSCCVQKSRWLVAASARNSIMVLETPSMMQMNFVQLFLSFTSPLLWNYDPQARCPTPISQVHNPPFSSGPSGPLYLPKNLVSLIVMWLICPPVPTQPCRIIPNCFLQLYDLSSRLTPKFSHPMPQTWWGLISGEGES